MDFQHILNSIKAIGKHIGIIIGLIIVIMLTITIGLNIYTDHGEKKPVPDFSGLSIEKAIEIAKVETFKLKIIDSIYNDAAPGSIIDQTPKPGFYVKENRTIFVTINSFLPEMVQMPDLLNISLRQAQSLLDIYGLKLGKLKYAPDFAKNYVLAQMVAGKNIEKGTKVLKGTKVDLLLGMGDSNKDTYVPNLMGIDLATSLEKITKSSLNVGAKIFEGEFETMEDSLAAVVKKQLPEYEEGLTMKVGSIIDLWLIKKEIADSLAALDSAGYNVE